MLRLYSNKIQNKNSDRNVKEETKDIPKQYFIPKKT